MSREIKSLEIKFYKDGNVEEEIVDRAWEYQVFKNGNIKVKPTYFVGSDIFLGLSLSVDGDRNKQIKKVCKSFLKEKWGDVEKEIKEFKLLKKQIDNFITQNHD